MRTRRDVRHDSIDRAPRAPYLPLHLVREQTTNAVPELSIIICTMRRHAFLRELLGALLAQTTPHPAFEIVVVDNDLGASAREHVAASGAVRYIHEPRPGVSHARNTGVAAVRSDTVLFLDDDQLVAPGFLSALWVAWRERPAHQRGLRLRFDARFEPGVRGGPDQARHLASLAEGDYAPVERAAFGTGGLIVERSVLTRDLEPFRPELGKGGGEDTDFYLRASERGYHFGHLVSVSVQERVTSDRARLPYLLRRQFRSGRLDAALDLAARARAKDERRGPALAEVDATALDALRRHHAGERDGWGGARPPDKSDALRLAIRSALTLRYPARRIAGVLLRMPRVVLRGRAATALELQHLAYVAGRLHANLAARLRAGGG